MYNIYYIEKLNAAGDTCEEYTQAGTAKERNSIISDLKKNPDVIEIGFLRLYKDNDPGILKTVYNAR